MSIGNSLAIPFESVSFDIDTINIINRMVAVGDVPTAKLKNNLNLLIKQLKANDLYRNQFDALVIPRQNSSNSSKLNLINEYNTITYSLQLTGSVPNVEVVFYSIVQLSNGDLLAGAGVATGHYYRSFDNGVTWIDQGQIAPNVLGVYDFCDVGNGVIVCGTSSFGLEGHILRSTDNGYTWIDLGQQHGYDYVTIIRKTSNGTLIAATENSPSPLTTEMLRSIDNGLTWTRQGNGGTPITVINMLCVIEGGIIIAGGGEDTGGGVFVDGRIIRSADDGITWNDLGILVLGENRFFGGCYLGNGIVLSGTANNAHILRSIDYGATWTDLGSMFLQKNCNTFEYFGNGNVIAGFAATPANGITAYSYDYGLTWTSLGILSADQNVNFIKRISNGEAILACSTDGILIAEIWKTVGKPFSLSLLNTYNAVSIGVTGFTTNVGINSNGINSCINSKFIGANGYRYKINDHCFGFKIGGVLFAGVGFEIHGSQTLAGNLTAFVNQNGGGGANTATYSNRATQVGSVAFIIGYNCISRNGAAGWNQYTDAVSNAVAGATVAISDKESFLLAFNDGTGVPTYFSPNTEFLESYWYGKSITLAKFVILQNILNNFFASL